MAVVTAARLCAAAQPNQVLVEETVRRLAASRRSFHFGVAVELALKGIAEPVRAMPLQWSDEVSVEIERLPDLATPARAPKRRIGDAEREVAAERLGSRPGWVSCSPTN